MFHKHLNCLVFCTLCVHSQILVDTTVPWLDVSKSVLYLLYDGLLCFERFPAENIPFFLKVHGTYIILSWFISTAFWWRQWRKSQYHVHACTCTYLLHFMYDKIPLTSKMTYSKTKQT